MSKIIELLPCPFCGGDAEMKYIGNDDTKTRKIITKCRDCRVQISHAAMKFSMSWLEDVSSKSWNTRTKRTKVEE